MMDIIRRDPNLDIRDMLDPGRVQRNPIRQHTRPYAPGFWLPTAVCYGGWGSDTGPSWASVVGKGGSWGYCYKEGERVKQPTPMRRDGNGAPGFAPGIARITEVQGDRTLSRL